MIAFQINGEFVDLPADPTASLQRSSPFFQMDGFVQEDYTLPIAFPNTPKNKRIFDFPHIIENANRLRPKWDAVMYYNGVPRLKGEIRAKSPINEDVITANFVYGLSLIGDDVKQRKLAEIIDETETIHSLTVTKSIRLQFLTGSARCALIINGKEIVGTNLSDLSSNINADPDVDVTSSVSSDEITVTADNSGEFEPFHIEWPADSSYLIPPINSPAPWLTTYMDTYDTYLKTFFGSGRLTKKIRWGMYGNFHEWKDQESPLKTWPTLNYYFNGDLRPNQILANLSRTPKIENNTGLAPMLTVKALLEFIETYYDISIEFFALNDDDVLFHTWTIDRPINLLQGSSIILFESAFNLNQLVPDITVNEFIRALQGLNGLVSFDPDTRTLKIEHRQPFFTEREYEDITDQCSKPSDIQLARQQGVRFSLTTDEKDLVDELTLAPSDFILAEGERIIPAGFGAPGMRTHANRGDFPQGTAGSTVLVNLPPEPKFKLKFARYIDDANHPYLDSSYFLWQGANGLIENYWKDTFAIENAPVMVTNTWLMPRNSIFATPWEKRLRIDRNDFFLKSFSVGLKNNKVSASKCQWVKMPTFVDATAPVVNLGWRGLASSLRCEQDGNNQNTGNAIFDLLEQYDTDTDIATGLTKINDPADPDYIAPAENLTACPLFANEFQVGNIYLVMNPTFVPTVNQIYANGTRYWLRRGARLSFPYPYAMTASTQLEIVVNNRPRQQVQRWRVVLYENDVKVYDQQKVVGPNNFVSDPIFGNGAFQALRTFTLGNLLFDITKYYRLFVTVEDI